MAAEGDLEPAAERKPLDRGDDRLRAGLDLGDDIDESRRLRRFAELTNIGPGDEAAALADDDEPGDGRIGCGALDGVAQSLPHLDAQGVDRRVVDGEDCDRPLKLVGNGHRWLLVSGLGLVAHDESVDGNDSVRSAYQWINVDLGDPVAVIGDELGDARDRCRRYRRDRPVCRRGSR